MGKAARAQYESLANGATQALVISPEAAPSSIRSALRWIQAEHPFPGDGSYEAGAALLEFFDYLGRRRERDLDIFLSGGASSLMWLPPAWLTRSELRIRLKRLYSASLTIRELNLERQKLCALKAGGAARWLRELAPGVRARVQLISDVEPFHPRFVGSGPFWDGKIRHSVLASNSTWVHSLELEVRRRGLRVLRAQSAGLGDWKSWVRKISREIRAADRGVRRGVKTGVALWGGEPQLRLPKGAGAGGRQSQIAAALALEFYGQLRAGALEILCASSDGRDGQSDSSATWLSAATLRSVSRHSLLQALRKWDTAQALRPARIAPFSSGTNVQDVVLVWIRSPLSP